MKLQVEMLREIGQAAWQYPDVYTGFLTQFGDKLRLGPLSVTESLARLSAEESKDGGADGNLFNPVAGIATMRGAMKSSSGGGMFA